MLCEDCRVPYIADRHDCRTSGFDLKKPPTLYKSQGCTHCNQTGFIGRNGIYELIEFDEKSSSMIHDRISEHLIEEHIHAGIPTMREDGLRLVLEGKTTLGEVLRVTREDNSLKNDSSDLL